MSQEKSLINFSLVPRSHKTIKWISSVTMNKNVVLCGSFLFIQELLDGKRNSFVKCKIMKAVV